MDTVNYSPKTYQLRSIPYDIYSMIADEQADHKKRYCVKINVEQAIYRLIRRGAKEQAPKTPPGDQ